MKKNIYLKNPLRLITALFVVILMSLAFVLIFNDSASGDVIPKYRTIIVAKGDTLWNIARDFSKENEDIRNKISEIKELNNIGSDIRIGQELKIRIN